MVAGRLQQRPYRVDLSERSRARIANGAASLVQRESCERPPRRLVDAFMVVDQRDFLQRSRLLSIGHLRISLRLADCNHRLQHHLHRQWRIDNSISGSGREPIPHDWRDGRGTSGTTYAYSTPSPSVPAIGAEASGNEGVVIGGSVSAGTATFWEVAFNDNLTGWAYQSGLALASPTAPTLSFSANPSGIAPGASSTLSWSSTNATSCSGTGFSPSGVSGSLAVSPTVTTTYSITCTGSGGSTTRTTPVIVNPTPDFTWNQSLPVTFNDPAIVPFGGTETRALVFMDGSLYAGIGDPQDPQINTPPTLPPKSCGSTLRRARGFRTRITSRRRPTIRERPCSRRSPCSGRRISITT